MDSCGARKKSHKSEKKASCQVYFLGCKASIKMLYIIDLWRLR